MVINGACTTISPLLQLIGQLLNTFKLVIPLILIVISIFDIGKTVISSKSDEVRKNMKNLVKKVLLCILLFFVPSIFMVIFGFVSGFSDLRENSGIDFDVCYDCLFNPGRPTCTNAVNIVTEED